MRPPGVYMRPHVVLSAYPTLETYDIRDAGACVGKKVGAKLGDTVTAGLGAAVVDTVGAPVGAAVTGAAVAYVGILVGAPEVAAMYCAESMPYTLNSHFVWQDMTCCVVRGLLPTEKVVSVKSLDACAAQFSPEQCFPQPWPEQWEAEFGPHADTPQGIRPVSTVSNVIFPVQLKAHESSMQ
jgi:hypothetical protein